MKKKKLKKKLKKLERTINWITDSQRILALKCNGLGNEIEKLKETIKKFEGEEENGN